MYRVKLTLFGHVEESEPVTFDMAIEIIKANFAAMSMPGEITIIKE